MTVRYHACGQVDDRELSALHERAFGEESGEVLPWSSRLSRHSLLWVTAQESGVLVGFVNVIGDGGKHAVLLDTVVAPERQGEGIGRLLVATAAEAAAERGCDWLHVDFEEDLARFYGEVCGFRATAAGLLSLRGDTAV